MNVYELQAVLRLDTGEFLRSASEADMAFRSLGDGIGEAAAGMAENASGIAGALGEILSVFGGESGGVLSQAAEGTAALMEPFDETLGGRIGDAAAAFSVLRDALAEVLSPTEAQAGAQEALGAALDGSAGGLKQNADMLGALPGLLEAASGALGQWASDAASRFGESAGAAEEGGGRIADVLTGRIPEAVSTVIGAAAALPVAFADAGQQMASGLAGGFASVWEAAAAGIRQKIGSLVDGVKDLLGIRSPSRVFADIGGNMARGLALGWEREFGPAERSVSSGIGGLVPSPAQADRLDFKDSAIGRSSAAGIASLTAAEGRGEQLRPVEIRLMLDGREAAEALYNPLTQVGMRLGRSGASDTGWR